VSACLLLHGAGSTPEFIHRAFGPAVRSAGFDLIAPDLTGLELPAILRLIGGTRFDALGGVSLGAHACAYYAARVAWQGPLYAVMPAWTGPPGPVAALTAYTADRIEQASVAQVLADITTGAPDDWVTAELVRAWSSMASADLVAALRVAAEQPAPTAADLADLRTTTTVVALADDPTHPQDVAMRWAELSSGTLHVVARDAGAQELARWLPQALVSGSR